MQVYKYDSQGFYVGTAQTVRGQPLPPLVTFVRPMDGTNILSPRWNGTEWKLEDKSSFKKPNPVPEVIKYPTLSWIRNALTDKYEAQCRAYGLNPDNPNYIEVQVFMDMIRDRINEYLILSDLDYKQGILLIEAVGIFDSEKADQMLALGGHTR